MNTPALIAELTLKAAPVKRLAYRRVCAEWAAATAASFAAIAWLYGIRPDLAERLSEPLFVLEIATNILLIAASGLAATAFAYPDRASGAGLKPMLAATLAGYSVFVLAAAFRSADLPGDAVEAAPHGAECLVCILSFAAIPALWMYWRLSRLASTRPMLAGGAALMMAAATGCLGVRLVETETASAGLIVWHYLPLLALSASGLALGKKIFRW